jgi:hypothetical protein
MVKLPGFSQFKIVILKLNVILFQFTLKLDNFAKKLANKILTGNIEYIYNLNSYFICERQRIHRFMSSPKRL